MQMQLNKKCYNNSIKINFILIKKTIVKQIISVLFMAVILYSCGNNKQNKEKHATQIENTFKPGTVATTANGYTMNAKINGSI